MAIRRPTLNGLRQQDRPTYNFLNHVHDFLLNQIEGLGITSWRPADDIVNLDVIIFFAHTAAVHGVGEFDEDGIFLHDALNVLSADSDDSLVVLIRHMERDRSRHFLLNKVKTVLRGLILIATDVDVEVVLVEAIEYDLNVA
jgi:hypothetical protein